MRVLLVNKFLERRGGVETYVLGLGDLLQGVGHDVQYFGMDGPNRIVGNDWGIYAPRIELRGSQGLGRAVDVARTIRSQENHDLMAELLERFQPDVVHFNNIHYHLTPSVIEAAAEYRSGADGPVFLVMTMHDYHCVVPCDGCMNNSSYEVCDSCLDGRYLRCAARGCTRGGRAKSIVAALESWYWHRRGTYRLLGRVVCPSLCMKGRFDQSPDFAGSTVHLPNFTSVERTRAAEKGGYVLYFGAYNRDKGVGTLLSVARRHPEIPFVFAGRGPLAGEMRGIPNVRDLGFLEGERLRDVVARASLAVVPSEWFENSPFTVLEALSAGTPVLGSDAGGIPELVEDGVTGELFRFRDEGDLERRLVALWNDPARLDRYSRGCASFEPMSPARYVAEIERAYAAAARIETEALPG